jgi:hypothetical protein
MSITALSSIQIPPDYSPTLVPGGILTRASILAEEATITLPITVRARTQDKGGETGERVHLHIALLMFRLKPRPLICKILINSLVLMFTIKMRTEQEALE